MSLTPTRNKAIIKQLEAETQTASGIFIPDNVQKKQKSGIVIAIGEYDKDEYGEILVGDIVCFSEYAGEKVNFENGELLVMHPGVFLSVIRDGKHQALGSNLIVEIESRYKKTETVGNIELLLDVPITSNGEEIFFNKGERLKYSGKVVSIPTVQPKDDANNLIDAILKTGDEIYFRYMNVSDIRAYLDKKIDDYSETYTIRVPYEDVFCTVRDSKIIPVGDWVLGEPFIEGNGVMVKMPTGNNGVTNIKVEYYENTNLIKSVNKKESTNQVVARHIGSFKGKKSELKCGDIVYSKVGINFENEINGKRYFCFLQNYQADAVLGNVKCDNCICKK
jgi:chaperonin GroES